MFFEIEFMDGVKRIIDGRGVMQYRKGRSETCTTVDGWGCDMEYFITSLSQGKAIVIGDWRDHSVGGEGRSEAINAVNIRVIKPVNKELDVKMYNEEHRKHEASEKRKREITRRITEEVEKVEECL